MNNKKNIRVGILGCTGLVGQRLIQQIEQHPFLKIKKIFGRPERAGELYYDSVDWVCETRLPAEIANMRISSIEDDESFSDIDLFLSALPHEMAEKIESKLRSMGKAVVSNAKTHRMDLDVPLLVPEWNAKDVDLVVKQKEKYKGGFIATNPNCCVIGISLAIAPIEQALGIEALHITTMQARSGAGINGLTSTQITANVIPNINEEETKIKEELPKIFSRKIPVKVRVNRVPVADGHTFNIWVKTTKSATVSELFKLWENFKPSCGRTYSIASADNIYNLFKDDDFRPQPRLDANFMNGMGTSIGRVEALNDKEFCMTVVSNNIVRGAAGGTVVIAECLMERDII